MPLPPDVTDDQVDRLAEVLARLLASQVKNKQTTEQLPPLQNERARNAALLCVGTVLKDGQNEGMASP
jgi:hypothetical protein